MTHQHAEANKGAGQIVSQDAARPGRIGTSVRCRFGATRIAAFRFALLLLVAVSLPAVAADERYVQVPLPENPEAFDGADDSANSPDLRHDRGLLPGATPVPASDDSSDASLEGADEDAATAQDLSTVESLGRARNAAPSGASFDALAQVIGDIWQNNPQVIQAVNEIEAAGYDIAGARTAYFPYAQVQASEGNRNASSTSVSIVQPLWRGGRTGAEISEAQAQQEVALADLNQTRLDLGQRTIDAYVQVALAQEQTRIWSQYIEGLESLLQVIRRRADKGASPPVDVETALSRLRQAQAGAEANRATLSRNRAQLNSLLSRPLGEVVWPADAARLAPAEVDAISARGVVRLHPQRQRALAQIGTSEARVEIGKSRLWPEVRLQHNRQLEQAAGDFTPDSSTQIVLSYQTDSGYRGYTSLQGEQQRAAAARQNLQFAHRDIANRIREARIARRAAIRQFESQAASARSAVKLVGSFLRQFKVGRKSWVEVLNAQQEANQALLQAAVVKSDYWRANATLALEGMLWDRLSDNAPPVYVESERWR